MSNDKRLQDLRKQIEQNETQVKAEQNARWHQQELERRFCKKHFKRVMRFLHKTARTLGYVHENAWLGMFSQSKYSIYVNEITLGDHYVCYCELRFKSPGQWIPAQGIKFGPDYKFIVPAGKMIYHDDGNYREDVKSDTLEEAQNLFIGLLGGSVK